MMNQKYQLPHRWIMPITVGIFVLIGTLVNALPVLGQATGTVTFTPNSIPTGSTSLAIVEVKNGSTPVPGASISLVVRNGSTVVWTTGPGSSATTDTDGKAYVSTGPYTTPGALVAEATITSGASSTTASGNLTVTSGIVPPASSSSSGSGSSAGTRQTSAADFVTLPNPIKCNTATCLIGQVVRYILGIIAILATLMFIWGGVIMLTAGGNEKRVTQAKETLTWAALGVIVVLLSWTIIAAVLRAIIRG